MNFYFEAAKALDRLDAKQGSIKGVIGTLPEKDRKRTTALIIETLKYKAVLSEIIHTSDLLKHERQKLTSPNLALLLVHDLLLSKGIQAGDGPIKQAILRHKTRLSAELTKLKIRRGVKSIEELAHAGDARADQIPRYIRINTLLWKTEQASAYFTSKGYEESGDRLPLQNSFRRDEHIPDLLLFHPSVSFNESTLLASGKIILQDKASCFPAVVLAPPDHVDAHVIDATAAPGNKTTLLCALMKGRGKLYAFERDKKRFRTLKKMLDRAKCSNVEPMNADFLAVDPSDPKYALVSHILLDPSCSGSGIVNRLDHLLDIDEESNEYEKEEEDRLQRLSAFQLTIIKHAMKFPAIQKIVYSTCSIHAIENEHVVSQALASPEARAGGFILARKDEVLPSWERRGMPEKMSTVNPEQDAASLVRCSPGEDHTNGFFVSCFIRGGRTTIEGTRLSGTHKATRGTREVPESTLNKVTLIPSKKRAVQTVADDSEVEPELLGAREAELGELSGVKAVRKRKKKKKNS